MPPEAVILAWDTLGDNSITGYQILRRNRDTDAIGEFTIINIDNGAAARPGLSNLRRVDMQREMVLLIPSFPRMPDDLDAPAVEC